MNGVSELLVAATATVLGGISDASQAVRRMAREVMQPELDALGIGSLDVSTYGGYLKLKRARRARARDVQAQAYAALPGAMERFVSRLDGRSAAQLRGRSGGVASAANVEVSRLSRFDPASGEWQNDTDLPEGYYAGEAGPWDYTPLTLLRTVEAEDAPGAAANPMGGE